ncbi:type II secretion system F family protein [Nakamurella leprariae]|uniref:Type II secretion system F family protein n=1 Tax=Nakamurella leprariae TaxID=2803911 RepID=A0A939BZ40_9ACTN|nr:type II secretion system F family protein [Nakamurella leprariae]MBM9467291.1 type II secretion system F family protein [Nakamurella leprariae]
MTGSTLIGALVGGLAAAGLLLSALATPPARRITLADRIAPALRERDRPSQLLSGPDGRGAGGVLAPLLHRLSRLADRLLGGQASVRRRLAALGSPLTVEQFRTEQVLWGAAGCAIGIGLSLVAVVVGQSSPVVLLVLLGVCVLAGALGRDWWLSQRVAQQETEAIAEFPVIAEMLALAVTAGEGPLGAIDRVTRLAHGELVRQLGAIVADTRSGVPLIVAVTALRDRTRLEPLARFLDGMAVAIDRGTPLADVLRAQAADVRALSKRRLLESGGRKEIAMMVPVVFLVLPITIVFAMFPGLIAITTVAG